MNNQCINIKEMMVSYLNNDLTNNEKKDFLSHLSGCRACRLELAFMLKLQKEFKKEQKEVPESIKMNAFNKIHSEYEEFSFEMIGENLSNLFTKEVPTPITSINMVTYLLSNINQTIFHKLKKIKI